MAFSAKNKNLWEYCDILLGIMNEGHQKLFYIVLQQIVLKTKENV